MRRHGGAVPMLALALSTAALLMVSSVALGQSVGPNEDDPSTPTPSAPLTSLHAGTSNPRLPNDVCKKADFGFVIDLSDSIATSGKFAAEKSGSKAFADAFQAAGGDGLYAGTRFRESAADTFTSGFVVSATFKTAVDGLPSPGGYTPTGAGITTAAGNTAGDRAAAPNVMFVITDGSPNWPPPYPDTSDPAAWLTGANAAIDAANAARSDGWVVLAIYVGTPDSSMPFGTAGNLAWVQAVMNGIGGGSYTQLSNFTSLVNGLLISVGCPTAPPAPTPTPTEPPTPTPFQSFQGETSTPAATPTPFESFQGETAVPSRSPTPPPTNTGSSGSNGGQTPLVALMVCLAFAGVGLLAIANQKRSIRR